MYQNREPAFTDMISVGVRFSLPLFQSSRQSPRIEATRADLNRAEAEREAILRRHRAHLESMLAEHAATAERLQRFVEVQLPLGRQREAVAEAGLAAGNLSITEFISARTAVLEMDLARLGLERRLTALGAILTLEHGEAMP
jgi:cobalt-zinc-cadmium efflux system outer membrane protein